MNEIFKKGLGNSVTAIVTAYLSILALVIIDVILMVVTFAGIYVQAVGKKDLSPAVIIPVAIVLIISSIIAIGIKAGLYGSYNDAVLGSKVTVSQCFNNAKKYFWSYVGYSTLYGLLMILMIAPIVIVVGVGVSLLGGSEKIITDVIILGYFIAIFFACIYILPKITLSVLKLDKKGFVRKHIKPLSLVSLIFAIFIFVPGANIVVSFGQMLYPLFILSLYYEDNELNNEIHELNYTDFTE